MPKFEQGDRAVHRSQRLDTLNTVEWIVYNVNAGTEYDPPKPNVDCRAVVREVSPMGVTTMRVIDASFYEWEMKTATTTEDE